MIKRDIIRRTKDILENILVKTEIYLIDVDYTKENNVYYLKIFINKEEGITIEECSNVSRQLSKVLDDEDYIETKYFLEVSSPGIDRPFKAIDDYKNNINKKIEINLYAKKFNEKSFVGKLVNIDRESIILELENKKNHRFNFDEISKANKHVEF